LARLRKVGVVRRGFHEFEILIEVYIVEGAFLDFVEEIYRRQ